MVFSLHENMANIVTIERNRHNLILNTLKTLFYKIKDYLTKIFFTTLPTLTI
jgi:hypothetical protein